MPSPKPTHRIHANPERHKAIAELAKLRGFKYVTDYLNALIDADAKEVNFEMPLETDDRGGYRPRKSKKTES